MKIVSSVRREGGQNLQVTQPKEISQSRGPKSRCYFQFHKRSKVSKQIMFNYQDLQI